jgi:ubiquinone biosynthesis protein COQ9
MDSPNLILASSLIEGADILTAEIGDEITAYAPDEQEAEIHKWKRYAVWATLTACALAMSWMAWSLTRSKSGEKSDDREKEEQA